MPVKTIVTSVCVSVCAATLFGEYNKHLRFNLRTEQNQNEIFRMHHATIRREVVKYFSR